MLKQYFRKVEEGPAPLRVVVSRTVRFEEVDPMGIVWHGRYPSYFEDARIELGNRYSVGYMDFMQHETPAPIKQLGVDYNLPLRFGDEVTIEAILHWCEAARINIEFIIRNDQNEITTTGYSVQLMLDRELNLLLEPPPFYQQFVDRWEAGEFVESECP